MKICLLSTDGPFRSEEEFERALSSLPFGEQDKEYLLKKKSRASARESLCARVALAKLCGERDLGTFDKTENGKPYFSKKSSPFFSLAHTKGVAAAALCERRDGLVGIDIELLNSDRDLSNIAKRFFDPDELLTYKKDETPERFYSIWTEKEARVKLFGRNLSSELSEKKEQKETLFFYKYKVKFAQNCAILCVACEQEQKEIIFINGEEFEIHGLQN